MSHPSTSHFLEYASARPRERISKPDSIAAILLCLPGAYCWAVLALASFSESGLFGGRFLDSQILIGVGILALIAWPFAVITALISLYFLVPGGWRKPWYFWVNLAVNGSGLLFTLWVFVPHRLLQIFR